LDAKKEKDIARYAAIGTISTVLMCFAISCIAGTAWLIKWLFF